jgi:hypothetical protein
MTDTTLISVAASCTSDPTELDRLAASLEAIALTFGSSDAKQYTNRPGEGQRQYIYEVALAA